MTNGCDREAPHRRGLGFRRIALAAALVLGSISAALADCNDGPRAGVDWSGCSKERVLLDEYDLTGANFDFAFLSGISLRGAKLGGARFERTELVRASFADADLSGANLEKALASRADFAGAKLIGARLVKVEFLRVRFVGADLSDADLTEAILLRNDFSGARFVGATLTGAVLPRAVFWGADLTGADLGRAFLYRSQFEGVDLRGVLGLTQAQLDETCGDDRTMLPEGFSRPARWPCPAE
jgi:uncharacterized protein YjbI with pentapeptide repeats